MGEKLSDTLENFTKIQWEDLAKYARQQVLLIDKIKTLEAEVEHPETVFSELGIAFDLKRMKEAEVATLRKGADWLERCYDGKVTQNERQEELITMLMKEKGDAESRLAKAQKYLDWLKILDNDSHSPDHATIHNIVIEFEKALGGVSGEAEQPLFHVARDPEWDREAEG